MARPTSEKVVDFILWVTVILFLTGSCLIVTEAKKHSEREIPISKCVDESGHYERECP